MAEDTANATTQLSSGASSMISGVWGVIKDASASSRGLIALTLILAFILTYAGKWPAVSAPPKADNSEVLSAISNIRSDIAALKTKLEITGGELGKQLDELEVKTSAIAAVRRTVKPKSEVAP